MRILPKLVAIFAVSIVATVVGCSQQHSSRLDPDAAAVSVGRGDDSTVVTVRVENQGFADVTVYALPTNSGIRTRLGIANGHSTTILEVPSSLLFGISEIRFITDPIGGAAAEVSDRVTVQPGDEVTLMIPPS